MHFYPSKQETFLDIAITLQLSSEQMYICHFDIKITKNNYVSLLHGFIAAILQNILKCFL